MCKSGHINSFFSEMDKTMNKTLAIELSETREKIIREIQAFTADYCHEVDGRCVVIVDQLLDFLGSHE